LHKFAQDFFINAPWQVVPALAVGGAGDASKKTAALVEQLVSLASMNLMVDLPLLTAFLVENLSQTKREQVFALLSAKAAATPPQLMRTFDDYLQLQEIANAYYRQIVQRAVDVAHGYADETKTLREALMPAPPPTPQLESPESSPPAPPLPRVPSSAPESPSGSPPSPMSPLPTPPPPSKGSSPESAAYGTPAGEVPAEWQHLVENVVHTPLAAKTTMAITKAESPDLGGRVTYPSLNK
jgi:hypothetical protein